MSAQKSHEVPWDLTIRVRMFGIKSPTLVSVITPEVALWRFLKLQKYFIFTIFMQENMVHEKSHTSGEERSLQMGVANLLCGQLFPKTAWRWKKNWAERELRLPLPKIHQGKLFCKIALLPNHTAYKQHFREKIQLLCKLTFHSIKLPRTASNGGATCLLWYSAVQLACYG